jgi:hypothetical protein
LAIYAAGQEASCAWCYANFSISLRIQRRRRRSTSAIVRICIFINIPGAYVIYTYLCIARRLPLYVCVCVYFFIISHSLMAEYGINKRTHILGSAVGSGHFSTARSHAHTHAQSERWRGSEIFTKLRLPYRMKRVFIVHVPRSRVFICQSVCIRPLLKCCRLIYANQAAPPASICIILKNDHVSLAWKIAAFEFAHLFSSTLLSTRVIFQPARFF